MELNQSKSTSTNTVNLNQRLFCCINVFVGYNVTISINYVLSLYQREYLWCEGTYHFAGVAFIVKVHILLLFSGESLSARRFCISVDFVEVLA